MFKANLLKSWAMPLKNVLSISYQLLINFQINQHLWYLNNIEKLLGDLLLGQLLILPKQFKHFFNDTDRLGEFKAMIPCYIAYCFYRLYELSASKPTSCAWLVSRCCSCRSRTEHPKLFVVFVAEGRLQCIIVTITHGIKLMSTGCAK